LIIDIFQKSGQKDAMLKYVGCFATDINFFENYLEIKNKANGKKQIIPNISPITNLSKKPIENLS
jgi:hypothetical protein